MKWPRQLCENDAVLSRIKSGEKPPIMKFSPSDPSTYSPGDFVYLMRTLFSDTWIFSLRKGAFDEEHIASLWRRQKDGIHTTMKEFHFSPKIVTGEGGVSVPGHTIAREDGVVDALDRLIHLLLHPDCAQKTGLPSAVWEKFIRIKNIR